MSESKAWCLPHLRKLAILGLIGAGAILISVAVAQDRKHKRRRTQQEQEQQRKREEEQQQRQKQRELQEEQQQPPPEIEEEDNVDSSSPSTTANMQKECDQTQVSCEGRPTEVNTSTSKGWPQSQPTWMETMNDDNNQLERRVEDEAALVPEGRVRNLTSDSGVVSPLAVHLSKEKVEGLVDPEDDSTSVTEDPGLGTDMAQINEDQEPAKVSTIAEPTETVGGEKALSDSGQGSEPDDRTIVSYAFKVPSKYCGMLIGAKGVFVNQLRKATECEVFVSKVHRISSSKKNHGDPKAHTYETCLLQGTRTGIEKCLELIREHMPLNKYPELTLEQDNVAAASQVLDSNLQEPQMTNSPQMSFISGELTDVVVTAIVSPSHVFVQHPSHSSWMELNRLSECMNNAYNELNPPTITAMPEVGTVCVAPFDHSWARVQVVQSYYETESCDVKFVDFGGFYHYMVSDLRKIRSDFMLLPFQATECYFANIAPLDGVDFPPEATDCLSELLYNQVCCAQVLGFATDCVPLITLEVKTSADTTLNVGRELVDRGLVAWVEHQAINTNTGLTVESSSDSSNENSAAMHLDSVITSE